MQKILIMLAIVPIYIYASYNPFFSTDEAPQSQKQASASTVNRANSNAMPQRESIDMTYFGFVESAKGLFALVSLKNKNIIIRVDDSLYLDERILKVMKITSNYLLLEDRYSRMQTVYFSSENETQKQ